MIEKILRFSLLHPIVILACTIVVAVLGVYAFIKLPIDAVPDITNNQIQINTTLPGFSPTQMEKQVTFVIENALAGIPGLQMTRSLSRNAFSQVTAIFDDDVNIYFARQQINERLNEIKENLPEGTESKMGPISTGLGEIYMWTVDFKHPDGSNAPIHNGVPGWQKGGEYLTAEGELLTTPMEKASYLRTIQDWIIKPQLKGIKGLAGIDSIGGYVKQYHVEPHVEKMLALGLNFDDIIMVLKKSNVSIGPGNIEKGGESFLIKSDERLDAPSQIDTIVVATRDGIPIRIQDIANVGIGKEMRTGSATRNGHEAVVGTALMLIGANSRTVAQAVDQRLKEIDKSLPSDVMIIPVLNRTKLVNATISTVARNLSEGAVLVIIILFIFLGQFRAALITSLVIPLSMLMTATGMVEAKISGNLMSLGAIDFGLIVDGAVIITENCLRRLAIRQREFGRDLLASERIDELIKSSKEMIQPTVFGQMIIIIVYIPILTLTGVEGKMFHPMALTVIIALVSAFILSITFVPAMLALFIGNHDKESQSHVVEVCKRLYSKVLDFSLQHSESIIISGTAIFIMSFALFFYLGQEFIPHLDEKDIAMHAMRIPSTSLTQSTQMQALVEKTIMKFPEVDYVYSKTGTAEMASDPMPPSVSDTFIMLKERDEWPDPYLSKNDLIEKLRVELNNLPGNNYEFTQPIEMRFNELISGIRSDVAVKIYGDNFDIMQKTAEHIAAILKKIPGSSDVKVSETKGLPVIDVKIDREAASRFGINVNEGLQVLSIAVGGGKAGQLFEGDRRFDIVVKLPSMQSDYQEALGNLPVPLPSQKGYEGKSHVHYPYVPLKEIAAIKMVEGLNEVHRENGKRFVAVQSNVVGRDLGSYVGSAKKAIAHELNIPDGYWLEWGGQFENLLSARHRLMLVVPICLGLILLLLYSAFHSFREALFVFSAVPFALTGGVLFLWIRDMPFSISAAVGFIALSGIAVLNGLVLISSINHLRDEGLDLDRAIKEGALARLRPVLMTALVASFGFIPMALATGTGAEVQKPLATVVIGGLFSSTILTLVILPALYSCRWSSYRKYSLGIR